MLPDVAVHGTWVRSRVHDGFGRLAWRILFRVAPDSDEWVVMWEPDEDLGTKVRTSSYHDSKDLDVRPYQPRPWVKNPPTEVRYREWYQHHKEKKDGNVRGSEEMSEV